MAQQIKTIRATIDDVEWRRRDLSRWEHHAGLPPPEPAAVAAAIVLLEVQAGLRPAQQLDRLSHYSLWPAWRNLIEPAAHPIPVTPRPLAVTIREVRPGLVDAAVAIHFGGRAHAFALRLDGARGDWELIELEYPLDNSQHPHLTGPRLGVAQDQPDPAGLDVDLS